MNGDKVFLCSSVHNWNGTRLYHKTASSLVQGGYKVELTAIEQGENSTSELANMQLRILPKRKRYFRPLNWWRIYRAAVNSKASYFHFNDPELLLVAWLVRGQKKDAIFIYDMYENFPKAVQSKPWIWRGMRMPLSRMIRNLERKLLRQMDAVIFAERSYKADYEFLDCPKIDTYNFPTYQLPSQSITRGLKKLVYIGDITKARGLMEMLQLAKYIKQYWGTDFELVLIGSMDSELVTQMTQFILENELQNQIFWKGTIPYDAMWEELYAADIGLCLLHPLPNYLNSLATKLYEYMAANVAIVASNFPDWQELIDETEAGVCVNPLNVEEVGDVVTRLLHQPELVARMGNSGRHYFEEVYNWDHEEKKLLGLYQTMGKIKEERCL
ncbi:glycosyltransferase family 4 protein [Listeria rocourtiae]|uniref:Glycosyltransferase involved in cell wall biosynthesis n=1 Tax=Listeria rocourtiae TaxID=647910 RepID=A0A4R6ZLB7_9LIST|nr:glycosyltransferase family 4 protein [Listeria rocourtiae]MBC1604776.1 glycosyltransferase family 4 protein [Listeria rocourtiae]TDR53138.1 glycosyltransferase involved in cell wall biosynthesis [Listeria rocourtiae]